MEGQCSEVTFRLRASQECLLKPKLAVSKDVLHALCQGSRFHESAPQSQISDKLLDLTPLSLFSSNESIRMLAQNLKKALAEQVEAMCMAAEIDSIVPIATNHGDAEIISFNGLSDNLDHIVLAFGHWKNHSYINVRIHSECLTGDVFSSKRCDCGPQLQECIQKFSQSAGLIVYLRQEGRGIGLRNKLRAYELQDLGFNTYEANNILGFDDDLRDFSVAAEMLSAIGVSSINLHSNNPKKVSGIESHGIKVLRTFTKTHICGENQRYLEAKVQFGGHDGLSCLRRQEAACDQS
jgi:GTP cyclohydrolase II